MVEHVLKSELAGTWYTDDPEKLECEIDAYLESVNPEPVGEVKALLLPHAGYRYSGTVAAHGIKLIQGKPFKRVFVLGPSHRAAMMDSVSIPECTHIETPLGKIEIDRDAVARLYEHEFFISHPDAHDGEHSVQIELPFLQRALGDFKLIPIVCGQLSERAAGRIGAALLELVDDDSLVIISSDFTHYGRAFDYVPFMDSIQKNLERLDLGAFRLIEEKDLNGFLTYVQNTEATICGRSPLAVLLSMFSDASVVTRLKYDTSGRMTGDWSQCVSYIAAAVTGAWSASVDPVQEPTLSPEDKSALLQLARHRITERLRDDSPYQTGAVSAAMRQVMGVFVTLHKQGQLRGCIGEIFPRRPLIDAVRDQAVNAAFEDPRFPQLQDDELDEIDLEISALTPPREVRSYDDIEIGKHGVVLYKGSRSAVFLPQVAPEQGWDLETTLGHLSMKAGLRPDDWRQGCEFQVFEAIVFGENM